MFNHHFYDAEEEKNFERFLSDTKHLMIVLDPPFGGVLEALGYTLEKICRSLVCKGLYYFTVVIAPVHLKMFIWASNFMIKSVLRNIFKFY